MGLALDGSGGSLHFPLDAQGTGKQDFPLHLPFAFPQSHQGLQLFNSVFRSLSWAHMGLICAYFIHGGYNCPQS